MIAKVERYISCAHMIRNHKGKCSKLHGHNYKVTVELEILDLNDMGMVVDFGDVKSVIDDYDHKTLISEQVETDDEYAYLKSNGKKACIPLNWCKKIHADYVTSENLAFEILNRCTCRDFEVKVTIEETPGNEVTTGWALPCR
ncbi:MAG: 6-pyruvoyl trahydropterin synthase family protein [Petrotogales bacterium]